MILDNDSCNILIACHKVTRESNVSALDNPGLVQMGRTETVELWIT